MEVKLSKAEIQEIAVEVAKLLGNSGAGSRASSATATADAEPATGGRRGRKPRGDKALTPEEAVEEFPTLTVRTIKRAITEGRLEPREDGSTSVTRDELQRFVESRK